MQQRKTGFPNSWSSSSLNANRVAINEWGIYISKTKAKTSLSFITKKPISFLAPLLSSKDKDKKGQNKMIIFFQVLFNGQDTERRAEACNQNSMESQNHATNQVVSVKKENYNFLDQNTRKTQTH